MSRASTASAAPFHIFLVELIEASDKTQRQIASEMGYDRPNVVSMLKKGRMSLPLDKVAVFAKAVGADPLHVMDRALKEYHPTLHGALTGVIGMLITANEQNFIRRLRDKSGGHDMHYPDSSVMAALDRAK